MRVILIGFMGVGKTSVGKRLAKKLNFDFIDTDYEIELVEKKSISKIFEQLKYLSDDDKEILELALRIGIQCLSEDEVNLNDY